MINTCVIPAAGKGSRWAPLSSHSPKEMVPLIGKPVIDWVVSEVVHSGCTNIIVVINKKKEVIKDYLNSNRDLTKKAKFKFIYQEKPLGLTDLILLSKDYVGNESFTVALTDLPTISKKPVLKQLITAFENNKDKANIISFSKFPTGTLQFYSECLVQRRKDKLLDIIHFCPKEQRPHHPGSKIRMSGRYVFTQEIFPIAERIMKNFNGVEINEVVMLKEAISKGVKVLGLEIEGKTYDTGNPELYAKTNLTFNLKYNPNYHKHSSN